MLKSPTGAAPWGLRSIARHLKDDHRNAFITMVNENFNRWSADDKGLGEMGYVGYILGDCGFLLLLKALRMDRSDGSLCHYAQLACLNADPSSPEMAKMADCLMSHDTNIQEYHKTNTIPARLVKGMDMSSCEERIKILASSLKVRMDHFAPPRIGALESVADVHPDPASGSNTLITLIRAALGKARKFGASTADLTRALDPLPECIKGRFVAWLYAQAEDIRPSQMVSFVTDALGSRRATGDDVLLLDRLRRDGHLADIATQIQETVGTAPEFKIANEPTRRKLSWEEKRRASWALALGNKTRRDKRSQSPEAADTHMARKAADTGDLVVLDEHGTADPYKIAARIGSLDFTAAGLQGLVNEHSMQQYLKSVIVRDASGWTEDTIRIIRLLWHPVYVMCYFRGLVCSLDSVDSHTGQLIKAVQFVSGHPWPVATVTPSLFIYEHVWEDADIAGLELLKAMVKKNIQLDKDSLRLVWDFVLKTATGAVAKSPADSSCPLNTAPGQPRIRAIETLLCLVRYAQRLGSGVPDGASATLTEALRQEGQDGTECRKIIGAWAGFLRRTMPEWFRQNEPLLFGGEAPDNLRQIAKESKLRKSPKISPDKHSLRKTTNMK